MVKNESQDASSISRIAPEGMLSRNGIDYVELSFLAKKLGKQVKEVEDCMAELFPKFWESEASTEGLLIRVVSEQGANVYLSEWATRHVARVLEPTRGIEFIHEAFRPKLKVDPKELLGEFQVSETRGRIERFLTALVGANKGTPSPLLENLSTEMAEREIVRARESADGKTQRTLRLETGPLQFGSTNSRHNFHLVKDSESAYVILKTKEFIEDAMRRLETRGTRFYLIALGVSIAALALLAGWLTFASLALANIPTLSSPLSKMNATLVAGKQATSSNELIRAFTAEQWLAYAVAELPYQFALRLVAVLGVSGILFVAIKMLLAYAKACVHEGAKQFERRHAMRFGWLYIELMGRDWSFEELKDAIQWNIDASSAFREIDLKHVADTTLNALAARMNELPGNIEQLISKHIRGASPER